MEELPMSGGQEGQVAVETTDLLDCYSDALIDVFQL